MRRNVQIYRKTPHNLKHPFDDIISGKIQRIGSGAYKADYGNTQTDIKILMYTEEDNNANTS